MPQAKAIYRIYVRLLGHVIVRARITIEALTHIFPESTRANLEMKGRSRMPYYFEKNDGIWGMPGLPWPDPIASMAHMAHPGALRTMESAARESDRSRASLLLLLDIEF